jgi:hypothetical protein
MEIGDGRMIQLWKEDFFQLPCVFQVLQKKPRPNFYVLSRDGLTVMPFVSRSKLKEMLAELERGAEE